MAHLKVADVVAVKRLLKFSDLTQKQIAEKMGIARTMVNRISTGARWASVKIDSDGELIEEKPAEIKIEVVEQKAKKDKAVDDDTLPYRLAFIDNYFNQRTRWQDDEVVIHIEPASNKSKRFIGSLWNNRKWLFENSWDDFISEIMLIVTDTVMGYKPTNTGFDWSLVEVESSKEHNTIHTYINKAIKARLLDYANSLNNNYLEQTNNIKEWKKFEIGSLDAVITNDGNETPLIEMVTDHHNCFKLKDNYYGSHFLNWFADEYEDILTDGQIKFLNIMKHFETDQGDSYVVPYSQIRNKPYSQNAVNHNKRRIKRRTENEWDKQDKLSIRELMYTKQLELLNGYMDIVNDDSCLSSQNELLNDWIVNNKDEAVVGNILDSLSSNEVLDIREGNASNQLLYKVTCIVEDKIENIKQYI